MFIKDGALEGVDPHEYLDLDTWEQAGNGTWYASNVFQLISECFRLSYPKTYHRIRHLVYAFLRVKIRDKDGPMSNESTKRAFEAYLSDADKFAQDVTQFSLVGFEQYNEQHQS